ncbi:MAG: DUF6088 family protein [Chlamydiales bacterium]
MQSINYLNQWLGENANEKHYLFFSSDLRPLLPKLSDGAFKTLLSRAVSHGLLIRLCKGLYLYPKAQPQDGLLLYHAAAVLRSNTFNYISLETVLSDAGVISQVPLNWITLMTSGRSYKFSCGKYGTIEFVHTNQKPSDLADLLAYDPRCGLWKASVSLALRDMKATHRSCDLIDWELANELI